MTRSDMRIPQVLIDQAAKERREFAARFEKWERATRGLTVRMS